MSINIQENTILDYRTNIILKGFNSNKPIPAIIDTGADISSLHANNVKITNGDKMVHFDFGDRSITMLCHGFQQVTSADGGTEQRPLVKFDVELPRDEKENDINVKDLMFNLNDRSRLPDKILLGRNFIDKAKIIVSAENDNPKEISELNNLANQLVELNKKLDIMSEMYKKIMDKILFVENELTDKEIGNKNS